MPDRLRSVAGRCAREIPALALGLRLAIYLWTGENQRCQENSKNDAEYFLLREGRDQDCTDDSPFVPVAMATLAQRGRKPISADDPS